MIVCNGANLACMIRIARDLHREPTRRAPCLHRNLQRDCILLLLLLFIVMMTMTVMMRMVARMAVLVVRCFAFRNQPAGLRFLDLLAGLVSEFRVVHGSSLFPS